MIATKSNDGEVQLIVYNYNETDDDLSISDEMAIQVTGLSKGEFTMHQYALDREHNNTYREWQRLGEPKSSVEANLSSLRKMAEISETGFSTLKNSDDLLELKVNLPRHSMMLIKLNRK